MHVVSSHRAGVHHVFVLILTLAASIAFPSSGERLCPDVETFPHLLFTTSSGNFTIELFEDAAPTAVRRIVGLVRGPIFNQELAEVPAGTRAPGFFDGLVFEVSNPHIEVITSTRPPARHFEIQTEIDASALGLDQDLVSNGGEAMDIMQLELAPERDKLKKRGGIEGRLAQWFEEAYTSGNADFLVGTSRQEINEALGYAYVSGRNSRPATRGMVALKPSSPRTSEAQLSVFLTDFPRRTGRWMVIGQVVEGLEIVDAISVKPLLGPPGWRNRAFTPREPTTIESVRFSCQPKQFENEGEES